MRRPLTSAKGLAGLTAVVRNEGRGNRLPCPLRHDKGVLAVALVGQRNRIALRVGDRQLVELVAILGLYGNSNRVALGSRGLVDRNRTVIRLEVETVVLEAEDEPPSLLE